ncbi:hypothetical protein RJ639_000536 [Escallonia herrerae]|uniref:Uncharacterized protein n=1 Tax=Escallonia herrerae TaxID=1293975 RepID=A0AA88XBX1_9ASTE|nr:hypothetical protein RJ639_000536 [Escallonia herrerae]
MSTPGVSKGSESENVKNVEVIDLDDYTDYNESDNGKHEDTLDARVEEEHFYTSNARVEEKCEDTSNTRLEEEHFYTSNAKVEEEHDHDESSCEEEYDGDYEDVDCRMDETEVEILTAVGIDVNNGMFPVAYAIAIVENKCTNDLKISPNGWIFISDKQKGLLNALDAIVSEAEHRHYAKHLYDNFKKAGFEGLTYKEHLWNVAYASYVEQFDEEMKRLKTTMWKHGSGWQIDQLHICPDQTLGLSLSVSFNVNILDARVKPVIQYLELIKDYLMKRMMVQRETTKKKLAN